MKRKITSVLLVLALCLGLLPTAVLAAELGSSPDPDDLNVQTEAGDGQITVTWTALESVDTYTVMGYTVYYCSDDEELTEIPITDGSYTYTISGLINGVTYYVGVYAEYTEEDEYEVYSVDYGTEAIPLSGTETAPGAPMITSVTATGKGSLTVNWTAPESDGGAVITDYEVEVVPKDSENGNGGTTAVVDTDELSYTVEDLLYCTTYTVVVRAINAVGSTDSDPTEVEVPLADNDIWVGGVMVTQDNASDVLGDADEGATVTYDVKRNTLTLDGFTYSGAGYKNAGIYANGELTVVLEGENEITCSGFYGIYAADSLTISGPGSLEVTGSDFGIYAAGYDSTLTIDGATVTAIGGDVASGTSYGIRANDLFTACNDAVVTASAGSAPQRSCGLYVYDTLNLLDNAEVTVSGGKAEMDSYGIRTTDMFIDGGSFEATGGAGTYQSHGIWTQNLSITDGTVKGTGGETPSGPSVGIQVNGWLTVYGGEVTATGGSAGGGNDSIGIKAGDVNGDDGGIIVEDGTVTAKSGTSAYTYGIQADNMMVNGGEVTAQAEDAVGEADEDGNAFAYSWGIQAPISLTISGGKVTATGGDATNYSYGIQATDGAELSDAEVTATAGSARKSYGIHSRDTLYFDHCGLAASGDTAAVYAVSDIVLYGMLINEPTGGYVGYKEVYEDEWHAGIFDGEEYARGVAIQSGCVITFFENGIPVQTVQSGGNATQPEAPTLAGSEFGGWYYYDEDFEEVEFNFETPVTEDITLHAKWNWVGPLYVGNERVTADNLSGDGWSYDIDSATLTLTDADITGGYAYEEGRVAGIYAVGDLNIELEGSNSITAPDGYGHSYGIRASDDLDISGDGSLSIEAGDVTAADSNAYSTGIDVTGQLSVYHADVTATAGAASAENGTATSCGVNTGGGLNLDFGGGLFAKGGSADGIKAYSNGIDALSEEDHYQNVAVRDGRLTAAGGNAVAVEWADSTGLYMEHSGLYVYENSAFVTLRGGSAQVTSSDETVAPYACSNGLYAYAGDVGIRGGTVDITGGSWQGLDGDGWAVYVEQSEPDEFDIVSGGSVTIACDEIIPYPNQNSNGFYATRVSIAANDGESGAIYAKNRIKVDDALLISAPAGGEVVCKGDPDAGDGGEYYVIEDANGNLAQSVTIEPLIYTITIKGLSNTYGVQVPVGLSANETYCEKLEVDDLYAYFAPATEKDGYTFLGFYTDAGEKYDFDAEVTGDITLTAKWRSNSSSGGGSSTYSVTVEDTQNGDITVSPSRASSGSTVTITVKPDAGYALETLTVLDKNGKEVDLTRKSDTTYTFKMPSGSITIGASFMEDNAMLNFFVDVPADSYYYDAVLWAAENGITGGTSATTFSPYAACTRAQTVTFLWRAAGSPEPETTGMPFTDVGADAYYYKAVLWAVENGVTAGTSATTFSPDATVTRAQNVTFLWRWAESPAAEQTNSFSDIEADAYYDSAVAWAAEEEITSGTSATTFSPNDPCLRSQIVTFLYRYMVG